MADLMKQYNNLKKEAEEAQQTADKAEGALGQVMQQLKKEFDCSTIEEAEKKLGQLRKQESKTKKEFEIAVQEFEEEWETEE
jgi:predicted  nucleic acid-binding Zn-ribbon protein